MKQAITTALSLIIFGFKLPYIVWNKSKIKLSNYKYKNHEDILDHEYIVTSWLDWAIDCVIFLSYPCAGSVIIITTVFTQTLPVLLGFIPIYFAPIFISYIRELGGSLMLLHLNVRGIEKNTHKEE
tara:strand:- start:59 stop:436 length:378 start_codon:yes stop_codon:yes gene_type:complete